MDHVGAVIPYESIADDRPQDGDDRELADLDAHVEAEERRDDAFGGKLELGQHASVELSYRPGDPVEGELTYIAPFLDPKTRTMRAADFDGDGDADLLGTASAAGMVLWYENRGNAANDDGQNT